MSEWFRTSECKPPFNVEVLARSKERTFVAKRGTMKSLVTSQMLEYFTPTICICCEEEDDWDIIWWRYLPKLPGDKNES